MLRKKFLIYLLISLFLVSVSCEEDETITIYHPKTVIIYMAADNNLSENAADNILKMKEGLDADDKNVIVYLDAEINEPSLIKIQKTENIIVKTYPKQNSATPNILRNVIRDVMKLFPSNSYGLVLWSHGTSWLPKNYELRSFGYENGAVIDIRELEESLPIKFDFILFDACLMGSIEVAYQLRDKAEYIISSPTEILADGFPYHKIISLMFENEHAYKNIAENYYNYYSEMDGNSKSASVSVIKTNEINQLTFLVKKLILENPVEKWNYSQNEVQHLDMFRDHVSYDFLDFFEKNYPSQSVISIKKQLEKVVIYKAHTEMFLGDLVIIDFCGLSCYIPNPQKSLLNEYYKSLLWCQNSGFYMLMD